MKDFLWAAIDALHGVEILNFQWETSGDFLHTVGLLTIGWGALTFWSIDGRPLIGAEYSYGGVTVWFGGYFRRFGGYAGTD